MRPIRPRRKDWDTAFKEMAAHDHDVLLDDTLSSSEWDQAHWEW